MATLTLPSRWLGVTEITSPVTSSRETSPPVANDVTTLLVREEQALRRTIARYVHHATIVDDLFQEISLKVMRRIDSVRDPQAIRDAVNLLVRDAGLRHRIGAAAQAQVLERHLPRHYAQDVATLLRAR